MRYKIWMNAEELGIQKRTSTRGQNTFLLEDGNCGQPKEPKCHVSTHDDEALDLINNE